MLTEYSRAAEPPVRWREPPIQNGMSHFNESVTFVVIYLDHTPHAWTYHDQHQ